MFLVMQIDLTKIDSYWLTCVKTQNRWAGMEKMLAELNIPAKKHIGELSTPYTIAVAQAFKEVLGKATLPVLLLEDDAEILESTLLKGSQMPLLELPDDADAFFIGSSMFSRVNQQTRLEAPKCEKTIYPNILKVTGMLGLHSWLCVTEKYRLHLIDLLSKFDPSNSAGVDDVLVDAQGDFNIYVLGRPIFYQNDGHSTWATSFPLENTL